MGKERQRHLAERFLALHRGPKILMLPNVWDVVSARLFEIEGFPAVATASSAISATLGYPDGEHMRLDENLQVVRRIAECVSIPVSADIEACYAASPEGAAESARLTIEAGAVGINVEDGTGDPSAPLLDTSIQADKITAIRRMANSQGMPLVINARVDVFVVRDIPEAERLDLTLNRAKAYLRAGADCIFVPDMGALDPGLIQSLAEKIEAPLNIIASHKSPSLADLQSLGVARVTLGPRHQRVLLGLLRKMCREWRDEGTFHNLAADALSYAEVNGMFERESNH